MNLNTSHVNVNHKDDNIAYVRVDENLNTSHVNVNR